MTGFFEFVDAKESIQKTDFDDIRKIIEQEGAEFFLESGDRGNPITYAQRFKNKELEKFLQEEKLECFFDVIRGSRETDYELAEKMLENDGDLFLLTKESQHGGMNALYHVCVTKQDPKMAELLIKYGGDVDHKNPLNEFTILGALEYKERREKITEEKRGDVEKIKKLIAQNTLQDMKVEDAFVDAQNIEVNKTVQESEGKTEQIDSVGDAKVISSQRLRQIADELGVIFTGDPAQNKRKKGNKKNTDPVQRPVDVHEIVTQKGEIDSGERLLHFACLQGNLAIAQELVEGGAKVNQSDDGQVIPIFYACCSGNVDLVKFMIDKGGDALFECNAQTLLHALSSEESKASDQDLKAISQLLINEGADPTVYDGQGVLASYHMRDQGKTQAADYLKNEADIVEKQTSRELAEFVDRYPNVIDTKLSEYEGEELSRKAVKNLISPLLRKEGNGESGLSANPNLVSTIINDLCESGYMCDRLFERRVKDFKGIITSFAKYNPDHVSLEPRIVNDLENASFDDVRIQCVKTAYGIVKDLVASYPAIDSTTVVKPDSTYLNASCKSGNMYIANIFLDDLFTKNGATQEAMLNFQDGSTPLGYCARYNNSDSLSVARRMIDSGHVDVNALDANGASTPLSCAIIRKNNDFVELIADRIKSEGKSIDFDHDSGLTPLAAAIHFDNKEAVKILMEKGADYKKVKPDIRRLDNDAAKEFKGIVRKRIEKSVLTTKGEEKSPSASPDAKETSAIFAAQNQI